MREESNWPITRLRCLLHCLFHSISGHAAVIGYTRTVKRVVIKRMLYCQRNRYPKASLQRHPNDNQKPLAASFLCLHLVAKH